MARFAFFVLLILNVAFGAWLYFRQTQAGAPLPAEINRDSLKIVSVADPLKAQQEALAARKLAAALNGAACVEFGVRPVDNPRALALFGAMNLGDRLTTKSIEEYSRFAVSLPARKDKKGAETLVANLKKAGLKDVSALADFSVSLGVFSSEEAANKAVADVREKAAKLVEDVEITPRNAQLKEVVFTVREPDVNIVARLTIVQREYDASSIRAVSCPPAPVPAPAPSVTVEDTTPASENAKKVR